jgi:hypothetical protein
VPDGVGGRRVAGERGVGGVDDRVGGRGVGRQPASVGVGTRRRLPSPGRWRPTDR